MPTDRRRVLITGASSGIGAALARELAGRGHDLALVARRLERLQDLRTEISAQHPRRAIVVARLDVTDHDRVPVVFDSLAAELGGLDRIVINAGTGGRGTPIGAGEMTENLRIMQTNFVAAVVQAEAAMRIFTRQRSGHLVFMSSMSAVRGVPGRMTAYAASKAGITSVAEGIRMGLNKDGDIAVTTLLPGYIRTEMTGPRADRLPFLIEADHGARLIADAMQRERSRAVIPWWPWAPMRAIMPLLTEPIIRRLSAG